MTKRTWIIIAVAAVVVGVAVWYFGFRKPKETVTTTAPVKDKTVAEVPAASASKPAGMQAEKPAK